MTRVEIYLLEPLNSSEKPQGRVWPAESPLIPKGARILSAGLHENNLAVYALEDADQPRVERFFRIYGAGWWFDRMPGDLLYIDTVSRPYGSDPLPYIWHIFEAKTRP